MRDEEDEPEQAVADQAGELPSIDLRYRIAEDESERMGVAGEGADVDRPTAARDRASSFPIRAEAWRPTPAPRAPRRSTNSPSAPPRMSSARGPSSSLPHPRSSTPPLATGSLFPAQHEAPAGRHRRRNLLRPSRRLAERYSADSIISSGISLKSTRVVEMADQPQQTLLIFNRPPAFKVTLAGWGAPRLP